MKPRVFVVQPIMPEAMRMLEEVADVDVFQSERMISRDELLARVKRCDYIFGLGAVRIDAEVMDAAPNLKGIAAMAMMATRKSPIVVDIEAATARKIPVTKIPHYTAKTTCDLTMTLILGLAWRIVEADHFTRCGKFHQEQMMSFLCSGVTGKTLGLIGLGEIGMEIAKRARAFEMPVIYTKRNRLTTEQERQLDVEWVPNKDDVLRRADFVSIIASYNASTHLMIGAREFGLMKPTAFFINTARGRIVDEKALVEVLQSGKIAGAGLDVFWCEPPVGEPAPSPELYKMDNVILTPHIGSAAYECRIAMQTREALNIIAMIKGERPPDLINTELYE
jgi:glyoxylate reductase